MPEEYVYKIVVDDGEVDKTIDDIDKKVVALTQRMDSLFKSVGAGSGTGAQRAAQQVEQATQRVRRAEQQTTQAVVRGQQQIDQARRQDLQVVELQIRQAERKKASARELYNTEKKYLDDLIQQRKRAEEDQERFSQRARDLAASGAPRQEIERDRLAANVSARDVRFLEEEEIGTRREVSRLGGEVAAADETYNQLLQRRQELTQQITESAQQQQEAEVQAAEQTAQAVQQADQQVAQSSLQSAQQRLNNAREIARAKQEEFRVADQAAMSARAEADAASRAAQLKRRAYQDAQQASKEAASVQKQASAELAAAEKENIQTGISALKERKAAADDNAAATKQAEEEARVAYVESSRASQDSAAIAKQASQERSVASKAASDAANNQKVAESALKKETEALAKQKSNAAKAERLAEREFVRTTKTFAQQRNELNQLAQRHGSFTVTIGKSAEEMNDLEKEVWDVIRADRQLGEEVDKLIAKQGKFDVAINRSTFAGGPQLGISSQEFRQAGFAAQRIGIPGAAAFGEAAAVGGAAGVAVAGVLITTKQLIDAFQKMASLAKEAFETIVKGAVDAAQEIEVARAQFDAFFQQDTGAAEAALQRLQQLSLQLGENVVGIGRAFLPEVESLDQLEEVTKIAVALARFQPEQGILGARISLQEALGGEFRSLQRRFEISPVAIDQIRSAFETSGVTGLLEELQKELERTGRSVEDLSDTFSVSVGRIRERWRQLLQQIGDPIIEEIKDQLGGIDDELERLDPDLDLIGQGFGEVVSKLVEMVGVEVKNFLETFDPEPLFAVVQALQRVIESFGIVVLAMDAGASSANALETILYGLSGSLLTLEGNFLKASLGIARMREEVAYFLPLIKILGESSDISGKLLGGNLGYFFDYSEAILDLSAALLESGGTVAEVEAAIADYEERVANMPKSLAEWQEQLESGNAAGEKSANTFLKMTTALDELIVLQGKYEEAQLAVNEAVNEFNIQAQLKFEKILLDASRARLDFEIEAAQKTLDIERKNSQKIADIRGKFDQDIIDAAVDLTDKEADILRKHGRAVIDLEDDLNDKRIEEEQKYQDELERIRDRFNFQAFEAMLANDAKQLRQIRRRQAFEESQAKKDRDRNVRDIDKEVDDRKEKLDRALERELEDARINNARKLRDLAASLDQQLAKQEEARRRDLEEQAISERRKRAELTESLDRQLEDYNTWWEERNRVTAEKIEADLELMRNYVQSAREILNELQQLGVTFNPVTGMPELNFSMPQIQQETGPAIGNLQERLIALEAAKVQQTGGTPNLEAIRQDVESLNVTQLVDQIDKLQKSIKPEVLEKAMSGFTATVIAANDEFAKLILLDQAKFLGEQVGADVGEIVAQTTILSLSDLQEWVDNFIAKYTLPEFPEFSIFGALPGEILSQSGGMSQLPGGPFAGGVPGQFTPLPTAGFNPFSPLPVQRQLVPGMSSYPGANDVSNVQGFFTVQGQDVPNAIAGQTPFIFPNVTDAPFITPGDEEAAQFVPSFGQAITGGQFQTDNALLPGNILGVNPAYGFSAEDFQAELDKQVAAQVMAELVKRGEIEDTVAFAELMIEKQVLGITSSLDEEVDKFQAASDDEIAILEQTLAKQQQALERLRQDPTLEAEAQVVQESIAILEDALERQREAAAQANAARIQEEANALEGAEETKQGAISDTLTLAEQYAINKANAILNGLDEETAAQVASSLEQQGVVRTQEAEEAAIRAEGRSAELEAEGEHTEARLDQLDQGFEGEQDLLDFFWREWLRFEQHGITQDLRMLQEWVRQRNILTSAAISNIPGGGGSLPGVGGDSSTNQASVAQLQSLAISQAEQLDILTPLLRNDIMQMQYDELVSFIEWLQGQLGTAAIGSSFQPGQPMLVGELGPEIVRFPGTGRIDPISSLLFRTPPPVSAGGVTNIDRSTNLGGFNFPDPRGLPPTYIKMMETIASNIVRKSYSGR